MTMRNPKFKSSSPHAISFVLLAVLTTLVCSSAPTEAGQLQIGSAVVDITPDKPVQMSGYASRKQLSQSVHDPLSARVVVFAAADQRIVLVSTDILGFYAGAADDFHKAICDKYDLAPGQLFLSAIHTHAAPTLTLDKNQAHENNFAYTKQLRTNLLTAVGKALESVEPAKMGIGVGHCPIGSNRRQLVVAKDGNSEIKLGRNPYGVADKEVTVLKIAAESGPETVMFNYATHATSLGPGNYAISGDVMGLAEQFIEKVYGRPVMAPAFIGASGDIDPWFRVLPKFDDRDGWTPEPVLLATFLGEEVVHVAEAIRPEQTEVELGSRFARLELPGKDTGAAEVTKNHPTEQLTVTVARVGNIGFVGLGAEVLTDIGVAIKAGSPFKHTFVITHCNGTAGYLPPERLYVEGGYEIRSSPFAPAAAEIVIKNALRMLHDLN